MHRLYLLLSTTYTVITTICKYTGVAASEGGCDPVLSQLELFLEIVWAASTLLLNKSPLIGL